MLADSNIFHTTVQKNEMLKCLPLLVLVFVIMRLDIIIIITTTYA